MAYTGPIPLPIIGGGTHAIQITAGPVASDGTTLYGNTIDPYAVIAQRPAPNELQSIPPSSTVGYALLSTGATSYPDYGPVPGSSFVWLNSQTASNSASINFTSLLAAPYTVFKVIFYSVLPVNDGDNLICNISDDNGATWKVTGYLSGTNRSAANSVTFTNTNISTGLLCCSAMTNGGTGLAPACGFVDFYNFLGINLPTHFVQSFSQITGQASPRLATGGGIYATTLTANAIQFICSTGNISSGTFALYGIKEAT